MDDTAKEKRRALRRRYYEAHREQILAAARASWRSNRAGRQESRKRSDLKHKGTRQKYCKSYLHMKWAMGYRVLDRLKGKCARCGYAVHPSALDFHHLLDKAFPINRCTLAQRGWAAIISELDKVIVLCANCHRIEHHGKMAVSNGQEIR